MTLVEMLVVVALIGTLAGATALGLRSSPGGDEARQEALILAARMARASDEALLGGRPVALEWTGGGYRFLELGPEGWAPHPVPLLGEPRVLDGAEGAAEGLDGAGRFAVTAAALPAGGAPLRLRLGAPGGDPGQAVAVVWDGATATVEDPAGGGVP